MSTDQKTIKAIVLTSHGSGADYSMLPVKDEPYPTMEKDDQVIVRVKASGLNFAELMQRQGLYRPTKKTPYTPGYEASGVVEKVGAGVTQFKVDDRVLVFNDSNMWKEVVVLPQTNVLKIPDSMTFEDAAGLIVNYLTAYQILFRFANVSRGDTILIHMAAGGVGTAAIQLCRTVPDVVIIGTASASKHDTIKKLGCDHCIDYRTQNYIDEIKKISPSGVDVIMDPLNGEDSIKGYNILRPLGRIVHFGAANMTSESRSYMTMAKQWWKSLSVNSIDILAQNKSVAGYHLGFLLNNPSAEAKCITDLKALIELYEQKKIKVVIDSTFPFSKIGDAMSHMHARGNIGKIILKPDEEVKTSEA